MSPAENSEAIEISFAFRTRVGSGQLHIADRFGQILYCVHSTQYSPTNFQYELILEISKAVEQLIFKCVNCGFNAH